MEGYIYLGEHYDVLNREIGISDKKIGLSINPINREQSLTKTKSPIRYRIVAVYKVDNMRRVEKMLHSILDSRRVFGEWFKDDDDTLEGDFVNFMNAYGAEVYNIEEVKIEQNILKTDNRLKDVVEKHGAPLNLVRKYLGIDYDVLLDERGLLHFNGEVFDTPNKLYNNGIVFHVKKKRGGSGTNNLSQFKIKETGERLVD
jgi:hypothetical protein|tara:strand:+ start:63 stop:665 length:603 start_codon:yes stop_codon:yes gene_type:complete